IGSLEEASCVLSRLGHRPRWSQRATSPPISANSCFVRKRRPRLSRPAAISMSALISTAVRRRAPIRWSAKPIHRACASPDAARHAFLTAGRALSDLSYETFGSSGLLPTETFRVRLLETGVELVIPGDRSMLDVLNEAGHEVISDCRRGECGVCAIDVVGFEGEIDHRDVFFSDHQKRENRKICPCVSRARGTITVDTLHRTPAA